MFDSQDRYTIDLVVIGAGVFGLAAARNFHRMYPSKSLLVLESLQSIGGTWAKERLHPDLKSNNLLGTYEYPDYPMPSRDGKVIISGGLAGTGLENNTGKGGKGKGIEIGDRTYDVGEEEYIPGWVIQQYLEDYARDGDILDKISFGKKVIVATHLSGIEGGWDLEVENTDGRRENVRACKMIIATGLTSQPFLPTFKGQDNFGGLIYHARNFWSINRNSGEFRDDSFERKIGCSQSIPRENQRAIPNYPTKRVTVLGATKSGWDLVYSYASRGFQVDWVVRESGFGPSWMTHIRVTPFKIRLEYIVQCRLITWMSPCIWGHVDGFSWARWLLQGNPIGRTLVRAFWWVLGDDARTLSGLQKHPETRKLLPWSKALFVGTGLSILNYEKDILEYVRNGTVKVHVADISHLSPGTVHLGNGAELGADAIACATGWKHRPPLKFRPDGIEKELGLPHSPEEDSSAERELIFKAEQVILSRFPILQDFEPQNKAYKPMPGSEGIAATDIDGSEPPATNRKAFSVAQVPTTKNILTSYRLFRFMIPPSPSFLQTRDIAFVGSLMNFSVSILAHLQGIWLAKFFTGTLPLFPLPAGEPVPDDIAAKVGWETILHNVQCRLRCPVPNGNRHPDFAFDALPYADLLCQDMGLQSHRKGWGREWFKFYRTQDYWNTVDEAMETEKKDG